MPLANDCSFHCNPIPTRSYLREKEAYFDSSFDDTVNPGREGPVAGARGCWLVGLGWGGVWH